MDLGKSPSPIDRRDELDSMLDFLAAASKAVSDKGFSDFVCPVCGGNAYAEKSRINGHVHASCDGCGTVLMG